MKQSVRNEDASEMMLRRGRFSECEQEELEYALEELIENNNVLFDNMRASIEQIYHADLSKPSDELITDYYAMALNAKMYFNEGIDVMSMVLKTLHEIINSCEVVDVDALTN